MKNNSCIFKIFLLVVVILALVFSSISAFAATLYVGPGGFATIQTAIDAASNGDTVLVADGIYTGIGNKDLDFKGKAITAKSENGPINCIIDCQGSGRGFYFNNVDSVISGFTITNGFADNGGAIYIFESKPIINNCIIRGNKAILGGGIFIGQPGYLRDIEPTITNCIITNNTAEFGGGIYANTEAHVASKTNIIVTNNTIVDNEATQSGGGIYNYRCWTGGLNATNCILWDNIPNQIIFESACAGFDGTIIYSNIQGGYDGEGNIDVDPIFVAAPARDYHLSDNSPCIDAGTSAGAPSVDIDGDPRPQGAGYDMGADEFSLIKAFVTRFYQLCLSREPDQPGLDGWETALLDGTRTGSDVAYGFIFSQEFIQQNTTNEQYLTVLYEAFFNRQPDSAGWQGWLEALNSGESRENVLQGFIYASEFVELCDEYGIKAFEGHITKAQREAVEAFVTRFYQLCLDRDPDVAGLEGWTNNLLNQIQTGADVANGFIFSPEFINKNTTNVEYLTILYKAFFNRDPDQGGWDVWLAELNAGKDRGDVLNGFLGSQEFIELCEDYGIDPN